MFLRTASSKFCTQRELVWRLRISLAVETINQLESARKSAYLRQVK